MAIKGLNLLKRGKAKMLKNLPSYQGDYEAKSDIHKLPSHHYDEPNKFNVINMANLLSTPIKCTFSLTDVRKVQSKF